MPSLSVALELKGRGCNLSSPARHLSVGEEASATKTEALQRATTAAAVLRLRGTRLKSRKRALRLGPARLRGRQPVCE